MKFYFATVTSDLFIKDQNINLYLDYCKAALYNYNWNETICSIFFCFTFWCQLCLHWHFRIENYFQSSIKPGFVLENMAPKCAGSFGGTTFVSEWLNEWILRQGHLDIIIGGNDSIWQVWLISVFRKFNTWSMLLAVHISSAHQYLYLCMCMLSPQIIMSLLSDSLWLILCLHVIILSAIHLHWEILIGLILL